MKKVKVKTEKRISCRAEKMVFGGQALGHSDGQTIFLWNALPGEEVEAKVLKKRKGIAEALADIIAKPSSDRIAPAEPHYLSCSPWQMMHQEAEDKFKLEIAQETYKKIGGFELKNLLMTSAIARSADSVGRQYFGYRNKMEYSFFVDDKGKITLALFNRGAKTPTPIEPCLLADDALNKAAEKVLEWIRKEKIDRFDLKSLIVRSNRKGEAIAGLFVKNENLKYKELPILDAHLTGFHLFYSTKKSPASVITSVIESVGSESLKERLLDTELEYGLMSFFQVNVPLFEQTLKAIDKFLVQGDEVIDYFSGVGSISIPLRGKIAKSLLVEINEEAIKYAQQNIKANDLENYSAKAIPAEKIIDVITREKVIILDPPRAGLHPDLLKRLKEVLPEKIIYLSCNISTQARDIGELLGEYEIVYSELYNYFPRTPHFESLLVLKKKNAK